MTAPTSGLDIRSFATCLTCRAETRDVPKVSRRRERGLCLSRDRQMHEVEASSRYCESSNRLHSSPSHLGNRDCRLPESVGLPVQWTRDWLATKVHNRDRRQPKAGRLSGANPPADESTAMMLKPLQCGNAARPSATAQPKPTCEGTFVPYGTFKLGLAASHHLVALSLSLALSQTLSRLLVQ
jgi:hypothetical protein